MTYSFERRLANLEAENRRLRRRTGWLTALLLSVPLLGAARVFEHFAEVRAERFVLTDAKGVERGVFELVGEGHPQLVMRDPDGGDRMILAADPQTAYLLFKDQKLKNRLGLAVDQFPHVLLHDEQQLPRIHLSVGVDGASNVLLHDGELFTLGMGIDKDGKIWRKPEIDREMEARAAAGETGERRAPIVPPAEVEAGSGKKGGG
ncbi:MAG: hypothetical protein O2865_07455 [Planctomycetota bacterium]|nr:hypothetical protein [Planctomycetota bacterium]MDA0932001.1 hypothetical protein [Planctomycetota bacterium]MDA1220414.1 hypothetical protein [Planctomycetota bacterium]